MSMHVIQENNAVAEGSKQRKVRKPLFSPNLENTT